MNIRIHQESSNKKILTKYLSKLINKFEITQRMEELLTDPHPVAVLLLLNLRLLMFMMLL